MKVYFNRIVRRSPWGGGAHFVSAMVDYLHNHNHTVVSSLYEKPDVIFMIDPRWEDGGADAQMLLDYKNYNPDVKIIHRINECDKRKGTNEIDQLIIRANSIADKTIFISSWLKDYFSDKGLIPENASVITNGCRQDFYFKVQKKISDPIKIVTHHWSDNYMKGFDVYEFLDTFCSKNNVEFTYIGRWNSGVKRTNTKLISPLYGMALGDELRKHHIYVTGSRWEPCGMHHIEGASCGLPVLYHREGGGINEICEKHGLEFSDPETFASSLQTMVSEYERFTSQIDSESLSMERCCKQYMELL